LYNKKINHIPNNFSDNIHEEIHPIVNLNNPFLDIYDPNFLDKLNTYIYIYNPYPEIDKQTFYLHPITNEPKIEKPPSPPPPPE
jgi:hypothetical protein